MHRFKYIYKIPLLRKHNEITTSIKNEDGCVLRNISQNKYISCRNILENRNDSCNTISENKKSRVAQSQKTKTCHVPI